MKEKEPQHCEQHSQHTEIMRRHDVMLTDHERRIRWLEKIAFYCIAIVLVGKFAWDMYSKTK
jgi:hypothetical protein